MCISPLLLLETQWPHSVVSSCSGLLRLIHACPIFVFNGSLSTSSPEIKIECSILSREEGEKLNVWVAWMNLENLYGSHEQLMEVFESALQQNEPIEVFTRLVVIYEESNKMEVSGIII